MSELISRFASRVWRPEQAGWGGSVPQQAGTECANSLKHSGHSFINPFQIEDLLVFDRYNLGRVLAMARVSPEYLAWSLHNVPFVLVQRVLFSLAEEKRANFSQALSCPLEEDEIAQARRLVLDALFWELTYWKTPELYEELVAGEHLHQGIFQQLEPLLRHKMVLDVGAGCGRASFAALEHGAQRIYAIEPSPGLRRLFAEKLAVSPRPVPVMLRAGDFSHMPLPNQSIDTALACSAFTTNPAQGGEPGLAELKRVTRVGGAIVLIWPRPQDRAWLAEHGFRYVAFPQAQEMAISFSSWQSAWRCTHRFYAGHPQAARYLRHARQPRLPFSVLGMNPPCDYCWLPLT